MKRRGTLTGRGQASITKECHWPGATHVSTLRFYFDELRAEAAEHWKGAWTAPVDLSYFEGHFPGYPLVPAAVLLEVSFEFLRAATDRPDLSPKGARRCKFKGAVTPGTRCRIEAKRTGDQSWSVIWTLLGATSPAVELEILTAP